MRSVPTIGGIECSVPRYQSLFPILLKRFFQGHIVHVVFCIKMKKSPFDREIRRLLNIFKETK